ncbi:MAG TPA: hypothetical protein ENN76_03025 [Euryarchaeota archaeon]|nr:hypothetical protein [Euryarchaeota archaeon]
MTFFWLKATAFCHATEDQEKVERALYNLTGKKVTQIRNTTGHYKNPILIMECSLKRKADVEAVFARLGSETVRTILEELDLRMDNGILSLRFHKQQAFRGNAVLLRYGSDVVSIKGKARIYHGNEQDAFFHVKAFLESMAD